MQKILIWDVESSLQQSLHFDVWETNIAKENVLIPSYIHCISYKFLGDKSVKTISQRDFPRFKRNIHDDTDVLRAFSKVVEQADILVAHNGDRFDLRKFNGRLLLAGLPPIPVHKTIDTLKIARNRFMLDWNSLDYIAKALGHEGKMKNPDGLWKACFFGDEKALAQMERYNRQDIEALEFIFRKIMPFVKFPLVRKDVRCPNPVCGSDAIIFKGTRDGKQRFQCTLCKAWGNIKGQ